MIFVFSNNASSLLASAIAPTDTEVQVQSGQGVLFPAVAAGQVASITLEDVNGNIEVVYGTGKTGDTLVVERAQEGTTALSFASGSRVEQRITAGVMAAFLQKLGGDILSGTTQATGVFNLGSGGSIQGGEIAGTSIRSQPGDTSNQIVVPVGGQATEGGSVLLTQGNLVNNLPAAVGFILKGMIVIWSGLSTAIPAGWVLCDGNNGTPNLKDQFIIGGGGTMPITGGSDVLVTGATTIAGAAVTDPHILTVDEIPSHSHEFFKGIGNHASGSGSHFADVFGGAYNQTIGSGSNSGTSIIQVTGGGLGHTHTMANASTSHTHTTTYPPYTAVFFIMYVGTS
jgi:hypothetical protein